MPPDSLSRQPVGEGAQSGHLHQPRIALRSICRVDAMQIGIEIDIFLNGQVLVQTEFLRHVADSVLDLLRVGADIDAQDFQFAGVDRHQSGG